MGNKQQLPKAESEARPQKGNLNDTDKVLFTDNFWILIFSMYSSSSLRIFARIYRTLRSFRWPFRWFLRWCNWISYMLQLAMQPTWASFPHYFQCISEHYWAHCFPFLMYIQQLLWCRWRSSAHTCKYGQYRKQMSVWLKTENWC